MNSPTIVSILDIVPWFYVTIGCNLFVFLLELYLDVRQGLRLRRYGLLGKNILPLDFARVESTFGFIFECLVLLFGVLVSIWELTIKNLEELGYGSQYQILRGISYLFMISFLSSLVRAPFEIFRVVYLDAVPGTRWKTLLRLSADQISIFLVSLLIGIPLLSITLSLLYWDFPFQWLITSIFVSIIAMLFSDVYAELLAPMFNKYTVLEDGDLRKEIVNLANKLEFPVRDIYTVDGSKRCSHSDAFLMGFWTSSVVLYDTLIKQLSTSEMLAILVHEIGHHKFNHTWKHLLIQLCFAGNFIFLFSRVVNLPSFYTSFGFSHPDAAVGLVLFSYLYSTFANTLRFVTNLVRRRFEYSADVYAVSRGRGDDLRRALIRMHGYPDKDKVALPIQPDPMYSLYHFAHPSLSERLAWLDHYRSKMKKNF